MITRTLDAKLAAAAKSFPYKTREGGATVTVFVPYDCKNNCPFCVNKEEYADCTGFSLEAIKKSMETMDRLTPYCDFVFTGGEPLANLESLQQMLDKVSLTHKVYINTTLPVSQTQTEEEILTFLERNKQKITCLNISRHMQHFVQESNDSLLEKLPVRFRINCVLYKNYPKEQLVPFMDASARSMRRASSSVSTIRKQRRKTSMTGRGTRSSRILGKWLGILALTAAACAAGSTLRTRTWNLSTIRRCPTARSLKKTAMVGTAPFCTTSSSNRRDGSIRTGMEPSLTWENTAA